MCCLTSPRTLRNAGKSFHFSCTKCNIFSNSISRPAVVKVPWDAREQCSCTSDWYQIAFLDSCTAKFVKYTQRVGGTLQERVRMRTTKWRHLCKMTDDSCLLQANMASNIHSHQWRMGSALMAGGTLKVRGPRWEWSSLTSNFLL